MTEWHRGLETRMGETHSAEASAAGPAARRSGLFLILATLAPFALGLAAGCRTTAPAPVRLEYAPVRLAIIPQINHPPNRHSVEGLARRFGIALRPATSEVLMLWDAPDPAQRRRFGERGAALVAQHTHEGVLPPNALREGLLQVNADLIAVFDVYAYGQEWVYFDSFTENWPVKPIRIEPHLDKDTLVGLRVRLYDAVTGQPFQDVYGVSQVPGAIHGRSFDRAEQQALDALVRETSAAVGEWSRARRPAYPEPSPAPASAPASAPAVTSPPAATADPAAAAHPAPVPSPETRP